MRIVRLLWLASILALVFALTSCGGDDGTIQAGGGERETGAARAPGDAKAELEHIHGLGIDPESGALYVATHYGLFRASEDETRLQRMGKSRQDIMGFSVAAPGRFIGSGHPDPGQDLPPNLGLIESRDGGKSWKNVSLLGQADFHVLRSAGTRIYGFNSGTGTVMVSTDGGRRWAGHAPPAGVFDLAIDPSDSRRIVASTEEGVFVSTDAGKTWRPRQGDVAGLLVWPAPDDLVLVDGEGRVSRSGNTGRTFEPVGSVGGPPSAFVADGEDLYAALGDGNVVRSSDGGASWAVRATP